MAAAGFLLIYPTYSGFSDNRPARATLLEVNGQWAMVPILLPVVLALVPVMFPHRAIRIIAAVVLGGFTALGAFSIGLFYLPAALAMAVAAGAHISGGGSH
jgi:hypothetical protein